MNKKHVIVLIILIISLNIIGCSENNRRSIEAETNEDAFSVEKLTQKLERAVISSESQIVCTYEGKAQKLNDQINQNLEECLAKNYICKNLVDSVDIQWEQKGKEAVATINISFQDEVELPIVVAHNADEVVKGLIKGWEDGITKVTVILEGCSFKENEIFGILDGAEINSAVLPCEADSVYYQAYDSEGNQQIVKMWLDFGVDEDVLKEKRNKLMEQIQIYGDELKELNIDNEKELYSAIYHKVLDIVQYDDSIAVVTDMNRLGLQTRISRSAYGALVDGETVCTGYARAYKALCDYIGLPCQVVVGVRQNANHSWNCVRIGGEFYYVDCTAGDTGSMEEEACMFTEEQMNIQGYVVDEQYVIPEI